jgi:hypothetical protein
VPPFIWAWAVESVSAARGDGDFDDRAATTLNRGLWPRIVWQFTHRIPPATRAGPPTTHTPQRRRGEG